MSDVEKSKSRLKREFLIKYFLISTVSALVVAFTLIYFLDPCYYCSKHNNSIYLFAFIITAAIVVVNSFLRSYMLSRSIIKPIEQVTKIINNVSKGSLNQTIPEELKALNNEVGELARAFDRTITSLKLAVNMTKPKKPRNFDKF